MYRNYRRRYYNNYDMADELFEDSCDCVMNDMQNYNNNCNCGFDEEDKTFPLRPELAQSYVPYQVMKKTFVPSVGLCKGTIFPELVSPYEPCQSLEEIAYIKANNEIKGGCNDERL